MSLTLYSHVLLAKKNGKTGDKFIAPMALVPQITEPFERLIIDIVGPIRPKTKQGYLYMLTTLCPATKFPEAIPLKKADSQSVVDALMQIFARIGFPTEIQSDLGSQFVSELTTLFLEKCGIKMLHSSVAHPQSNSVERFHRTLKSVLRAVCHEHPQDWERCLPGAMFALRTVPHESTKFTPSELVYGRNIKGPLDLLKEHWAGSDVHPSVLEYVLDLLQRFKYSREMAVEVNEQAKLKSKQYYDRKSTERYFKPDDMVMVLKPSRTNKLEIHWDGPNKVVQRLSDTNYLVEKSSGRKKPTVYHVNLLKPFIARQSVCNLVSSQEVDCELEHEWTGQAGDGPLTANDAIASFKSLGQLTDEQLHELCDVFHKVDGVFSTLPGLTNLVTHDIVLKEPGKIIPSKFYRHGLKERELIIAEVHRMEALGLIRPSKSPYGAPMIIVCKEGSKPRPVADYRELNKEIETHDHPIPNIEDCVEKASKWKYISIFDLNRGFWQVPLTERATQLAALSTPLGKYEPTIMKMGMKNAPFCFQKLMEQVCHGMESFTTPFQDDTAVGSETWPDHLDHILTFLTSVKNAGLTVNASKCQIAGSCVTYLGHEIGLGKRSPSDIKIQAVNSFKRPITKRDVCSFLGLIGYYQRYIPQYSQLCSPLTDSLRKSEPDQVTWNDDKQSAFVSLKEALMTKPVLRAPNYDEPFIIQCDCSDRGMGVILCQNFNGEEHPCLYLSRKLTERETRYGTTEKECACLVWAVAKLRPYIFGTHFIIESDHNPLHWLRQVSNSNARLLRWSLALQDLDFEVRYKPGKEHTNADALSRYFVE